MTTAAADERAQSLRQTLLSLLDAIEAEEADQRAALDAVSPRHRRSAANLIHYLALRSQDLHRLQLELAAVGLSSLGRSEGHVRDTLRRLDAWLAGDRVRAVSPPDDATLDSKRAEAILHANTQALFGPRPKDRHVYVMVTAPEAAQVTPAWAESLLNAGANSLRINAAHEGPEQWRRTALTFKAQAAVLGVPARVFVDMPGPKFRADVLALEAGVTHLPRQKDRYGRTTAPTRLQLVSTYGEGLQLALPQGWLPGLHHGDQLDLTDAAGRNRRLTVELGPDGTATALCERSLYIASDLPLRWRRGSTVLRSGRSGPMPRRPRELRLAPGDAFVLRAGGEPCDGDLPELFVPEPELLQRVRPGHRVILDDGRIFAAVERAGDNGLICRVRRTLKASVRLKSGKGIAFPDSELEAGELGEQDERALAVALEVADGVGVSFVNSAADVAGVRQRIERAERPGFGLLLKLETQRAMSDLPSILLEALKYHPVGLMIARGDLAIELSFERLAEMQEELLWFGEACHLPVVWATQVLETVAHSGLATRAEVTDAAMSMRAECVMLNKGPHIDAATRMLVDIIRKMETHQYKKRSLFRKLAIATRR